MISYPWLAADKHRGSKDAGEYKHVVLGLIFLKFVSDSFNNKYEDLVKEETGFEEDRDGTYVCGGAYDSFQQNPDGIYVCGGAYDSFQHG